MYLRMNKSREEKKRGEGAGHWAQKGRNDFRLPFNFHTSLDALERPGNPIILLQDTTQYIPEPFPPTHHRDPSSGPSSLTTRPPK